MYEIQYRSFGPWLPAERFNNEMLKNAKLPDWKLKLEVLRKFAAPTTSFRLIKIID